MSMHSLCACHFFRRRPFHQERERNEERDNHSEDKERTDKREHTGLRVNHQLKLRESMLGCIGGTAAGVNCCLLQSCKVPVKEDIAAMKMRHQADTADLP